ncbi:D-beta-hydroxybutyrate dehydrogenase, mitochondrial-like isoform X2 [Homarus americanus]|uniref:D-beta-hydroxybutyrate dehydrogenase, mitochondrial-like isoform X2 n=1 Tax=Homarus americanus TaxID=6706 RepID=UPI001C464691|nr:D-beta-hydroxybutyrate dehydrogenase, mitochondrial-like isoform X2 [Homarus americanus]
MLWTWDKTEAVVTLGGASAVLASVIHAVSSCCCWTLFLLLWVLSAATYIVSSALQVSPEGRGILVTGCDSGFGLALAFHLHKLGFRVFAGCLLAESGGTGAEELQKVKSRRLHVLQLDVTSQKQIDKAVADVKKMLPGGEVLWGVVNNAGWATYGEIEWVPLETVRRAVDTNVLGVLSVTKAFLPLIRRAKGRVVTISSGLARMAVPMRSAYVLSKYAVEGFCDVLRYEMRSWGVKVSIIEPGNYIAGTNIFTESLIQEHGRKMWEAMSEEVKADYGKDHFQARIDLMRQYSKAGIITFLLCTPQPAGHYDHQHNSVVQHQVASDATYLTR